MIPIVWTDLTINDFSKNIYYLEKEWTEKEVEKFIKKPHEIFDKLSKDNITIFDYPLLVPILKKVYQPMNLPEFFEKYPDEASYI